MRLFQDLPGAVVSHRVADLIRSKTSMWKSVDGSESESDGGDEECRQERGWRQARSASDLKCKLWAVK